MKGFLLGIVLLAIFLTGYYIMKHIDEFLGKFTDENR